VSSIPGGTHDAATRSGLVATSDNEYYVNLNWVFFCIGQNNPCLTLDWTKKIDCGANIEATFLHNTRQPPGYGHIPSTTVCLLSDPFRSDGNDLHIKTRIGQTYGTAAVRFIY
jgi:hypothetical protein